MEAEQLLAITSTIEGIPVKNLAWRPTDNIITGLVQCPTLGNPNLHDGYVSGAWRKNGTPTNRIKGMSELKLNLVVSE
jgi:hypothetical protein